MTFKTFGRRSPRPSDPRRYIINQIGYGKSWPKQRLKALERDDYTCQKCGYKGKRGRGGRWDVHVHHRRKIAWFVNSRTKEFDEQAANSLDNLITLCPKCHKVADGHAKMEGFVSL